MLNDADASGFKKVYLAMGFTDLRCGIDGLAGIIRFQFNLDPYDKNTLFLFCGRRCDRIKALLWEGLSVDFCYPHISLFYSVTHGMFEKSMRIKIYDVSSFLRR